jgi:hypothetical protein
MCKTNRDSFKDRQGEAMFQNLGDTMFGARNIGGFETAMAYQGYPPAERRCSSWLELAKWFSDFAIACRASLPKQEN